MATEDDNFDIDIYGDGGGFNANDQGDSKREGDDLDLDIPESVAEPAAQGTTNDTSTHQTSSSSKPQTETSPLAHPSSSSTHPTHSSKSTNGERKMSQQLIPTDENAMGMEQPLTLAPHGVKRKEPEDSDPDATTALVISELYWWTTDDDIRGWVNKANAENDLKEVTFSEHKVNGKSKGQVFVEFTTPQAAAATKHYLETTLGRKHPAHYVNAHMNPFKTHPKDGQQRREGSRGGSSSGFNSPAGSHMNFGGAGANGNMNGGGYRGRGGYNNRGMGSMGGFNNRNTFNMGGFQSGAGPAGGNMMGGFQAGPMNMPNYGFNNRGGMMNMRGGPGMRGGRGGNMAGMMMPAMNQMNSGMGMNPMAGGMNPMMGNMGGNMGMQGPPNPAFNQNYYGANQGGDGAWNPHGNKRSRQE